MSASAAPRPLAAAVVRRGVECRNCRYDLRGIRADGRCPECGLAVWESIRAAVDPKAAALPQLRNPAAVGDGLLWLMVCILIAALLVMARPVALALETLDPRGAGSLSRLAPPELRAWSGLVALAGLYGVWLMLPPRGQEPGSRVRRDLARVAIGAGLWSAGLGVEQLLRSGAMLRHGGMMLFGHAIAAAAATVVFLGIDGILRAIGERSRQYRTSHGGRQSIQAMLAAVAVGLVGDTLRTLALEGLVHRNLRVWGRNIMWIALIMLVIGMVYLVVNAWWIRRSLRRPPPLIADILAIDRSANMNEPPR